MFVLFVMRSYLIEVRGLKQIYTERLGEVNEVVSYRGTWVETLSSQYKPLRMSGRIL